MEKLLDWTQNAWLFIRHFWNSKNINMNTMMYKIEKCQVILTFRSIFHEL